MENHQRVSAIPILKEDNYKRWKTGIRAYLVVRGLWDIVDPENRMVKSEEETLNEHGTTKEVREAEVTMILNGYLSDEIVNSIDLSSLTPRETWNTLRSRFEKKTVVHVVDAMKKLRMDPDDEDPLERITRIRESGLVLRANKLNFDQEMILHYFAGLRYDPTNLKTQWYKVSMEEWNLDEFVAHIASTKPEPGSKRNPIEVINPRPSRRNIHVM
ncbi:hypothetical protein IWQ62_004673 [Dispira parvispora]|uniref:DUF4219 domain-containing protein n=1 Tax=Dispira parvispora TaxID=1520584 RepID=A0A9W8E5E3_9FUNG|nr:hypothetical protein IWQ62_004673 [Dispira parvispora]